MEHLTTFIIWTFTLFGLTGIVTQSKLMEPVRQRVEKFNSVLGTLVSCPQCFGFWAGITLGQFYQSLTGNLVFDGLLGSGLIWYILYEHINRH